MKVITDKTSNKNIENMLYVSYFGLIPKITFKDGIYFRWDEEIQQAVNKFAVDEEAHYGFVRKINFLKNINKILKRGVADRYDEKLFLIGQLYIDGFKWMITGKKKIMSFEDGALFPVDSINFFELLALLCITFPTVFKYKKNILENSGISSFLEYTKWVSATRQEYVAENYMRMYNNKKIIGGFDIKKEFCVLGHEGETSLYTDFKTALDIKQKYIDSPEKFTIYKFFYTMEKFFNVDMFYSNFILQRLLESMLIKSNKSELVSNIELGDKIKEKFILYINNQRKTDRVLRESFLYALINAVKEKKFTFKCTCGGTCIKIDKYNLRCLACRKQYVFPHTPTDKDFWKAMLIKNGKGIYFSSKGKRMVFKMEEKKKERVVQCTGVLKKV